MLAGMIFPRSGPDLWLGHPWERLSLYLAALALPLHLVARDPLGEGDQERPVGVPVRPAALVGIFLGVLGVGGEVVDLLRPVHAPRREHVGGGPREVVLGARGADDLVVAAVRAPVAPVRHGLVVAPLGHVLDDLALEGELLLPRRGRLDLAQDPPARHPVGVVAPHLVHPPLVHVRQVVHHARDPKVVELIAIRVNDPVLDRHLRHDPQPQAVQLLRGVLLQVQLVPDVLPVQDSLDLPQPLPPRVLLHVGVDNHQEAAARNPQARVVLYPVREHDGAVVVGGDGCEEPHVGAAPPLGRGHPRLAEEDPPRGRAHPRHPHHQQESGAEHGPHRPRVPPG
mmetsp:Transcript_65788/g.208218  ORF Transcript_65788/g.208218 Transcript_65788/m.208218 type:complete len:340 (+) Transcript_65788:171-1190(+)